MGHKTPLFDTHVEAHARMVDFGGWDMPVNYGSQIEEHHAVRRDAGMFDVSHMLIADVTGARAREYLRHLLANDVAKLKSPGKALYSCMLNEQGGVVDDLIVYFLREDWFRVVVNAGTRDKDIAWLKRHVGAFARRRSPAHRPRDDRRTGTQRARQGRDADRREVRRRARSQDVSSAAISIPGSSPARVTPAKTAGKSCCPSPKRRISGAPLRDAGVAQCGLGARDTLRLEAGMNLYGNDMDETQSPLESGLTWTVAFDPPERDFVGRAALDAQRRAGVATQARRSGSGGARRAAQPSEGGRSRRRRRRTDQRHLFADARALHRFRARARRNRRARRRRHSRQAACPHASSSIRSSATAKRWWHRRMRDRISPPATSPSLITNHNSHRYSHELHPADLKYLDSHEWARVESDGIVTIGISDHAQGALGRSRVRRNA